jgi:hypothetical protein
LMVSRLAFGTASSMASCSAFGRRLARFSTGRLPRFPVTLFLLGYCESFLLGGFLLGVCEGLLFNIFGSCI